MYDNIFDRVDEEVTRPAGFLAGLADDQRKEALAHTGDDTHPRPAGEGEREAVARIIAGRPWSFSKDAVASKADAILSLLSPAAI